MIEDAITAPRRGLIGGPIAGLWGQPYPLLTLTALMWSGNIVVGRALHGAVPPIALSFWRWLLTFLIVSPFAWPHLRRDWPVLKRRWPILALLALFGLVAYSVLSYSALQSTTALNASLLQPAMPAMVLIWGFLIFRDRPTAMQLWGLLVSVIGVVVIVARGRAANLAGLRLNLGDGLMLAGLCAYGMYTVLLRLRPAVHPMSLLASAFALAGLILLPVYLADLARGARMQLSPSVGLGFAYLCLLPSFVAYLFYNRGVQLIGAARAGQFIHLIPAFGALLAVLFLGERPHLFHLEGVALIFAGIVLASRGARSDKA